MVYYLDKWSQFDEFRKRRVFFVNIPTQHTFEDYYCAVLNGFCSEAGPHSTIMKTLVAVWHRISHNVRYNLHPPYKLAFLIARPPNWEPIPMDYQEGSPAYTTNGTHNTTGERLVRVFPPTTKHGKEQQDIGLNFPMTPQGLRKYGEPLYIEALMFNFIQTFIVNQELSVLCSRDQLVASEIFP